MVGELIGVVVEEFLRDCLKVFFITFNITELSSGLKEAIYLSLRPVEGLTDGTSSHGVYKGCSVGKDFFSAVEFVFVSHSIPLK